MLKEPRWRNDPAIELTPNGQVPQVLYVQKFCGADIPIGYDEWFLNLWVDVSTMADPPTIRRFLNVGSAQNRPGRVGP